MSNFTKEELYRLYDILLPHFVTLAEEASANDVHFEVDIAPDGNITFKSRQYFTENNKKSVRTHQIEQGKDFVSDSSRTKVLEVLADDMG